MMHVTKIVGLGAGGHAKPMLEMLAAQPEFELVGLLDPAPEKHGCSWGGAKVLGADSLLPDLARQGVKGFFVGMGSVGDVRRRIEAYSLALGLGLEPITLVHRTAVVASSARLGRGVCVMMGAMINSDVTLGENVCVNTGAIVEHDCTVGAHSFVASGAALAGGVQVGEAAFIGMRAGIRQGCRIGLRAVVGGGAMVLADVPEATTVVGIPAKQINHHD